MDSQKVGGAIERCIDRARMVAINEGCDGEEADERVSQARAELAALRELYTAALDTIAWEAEYREINNLGTKAPHSFKWLKEVTDRLAQTEVER